MSGVKLPALGSLKDRVLRDYQLHESRKKMKQQELQLCIALLNAGDESTKRALLAIWQDIAKLEYGVDADREDTSFLRDEAMRMEFENVRKLKVRLERTGAGKDAGLQVTGL